MKNSASAWTRRNTLKAAAAAGIGSAVLARAAPLVAAQPTRPNIVFIMADDLGYADLSFTSVRAQATPNIDRIAREGLAFPQSYANSCVCSPTRTALITGRYQQRLEVGLHEPLGIAKVGVPAGQPTLPSLLRKAGYRTALVGKWHLGDPPAFGPLQRGYDRFYGITSGGTDYFKHHGNTSPGGNLIDGESPADDVGYMTDLLANRAVAEIEDAASAGMPLFLSMHFTAPHWPWEGPEDEAVAASLGNIRHLDGGSLAVYATMLASLDRNVGRILATLDRLGLADDAIVIFTSDNGGERFSDTWPFIGMKGELLEGGIRVPAFMRWPGRIEPGRLSPQVTMSMDWLPTLLAAIGASPDPGFPPDGENLLPVILGETPAWPRSLYWRYKANAQGAVRYGDWKYLTIGGREYLFDLALDERERADLKNHRPDIHARLKSSFAQWSAQMLPYTDATVSSDNKPYNADRY